MSIALEVLAHLPQFHTNHKNNMYLSAQNHLHKEHWVLPVGKKCLSSSLSTLKRNCVSHPMDVILNN